VHIVANQYHSAVFYVFLHCSSETTLRIFRELVCLVDDQNLKAFSALGFDVSIGGYFFHNILNDMPIVVLVVRRRHFNVVVACENAVLDGGRSVFRLEDSLLLLELEDMIAKYSCNEGIGSCFFASSVRTVKDHVLHNKRLTGKSEVSASCPSTLVISGW
jgi:hypothetical protein